MGSLRSDLDIRMTDWRQPTMPFSIKRVLIMVMSMWVPVTFAAGFTGDIWFRKFSLPGGEICGEIMLWTATENIALFLMLVFVQFIELDAALENRNERRTM